MKLYQHVPLSDPGRMIRILALHPAQSRSAALSGTVSQFNFNSSDKSACHYEALSYVWGPPSTLHEIQIGDLTLPITANCDAALRSLRRPSEDRLLWVDSICIDQTAEGTFERNHQVAMMGEVYKTAKVACIWVSDGDLKSDALFVHLQALHDLRDESYADARHNLCNEFMNNWG